MKNENRNTHNENPTIIFEPIVPHPEPVVIGQLLDEIETIIKRHVVLSEQAATALAAWVLHTYVFELRDTVAYVAIESPEKRCGKTTLLSVLGAMANKPLIASNVTVGALFRSIDTCRPTLLIDEADTFLAGNSTMRGIINSGNTWRTAYVLRLSKSNLQPSRARAPGHLEPEKPDLSISDSLPVPPSEISQHSGSNSGLQRYSCWCPKVVAMIGKVPDTIADRSIVVHLTRKLIDEICAPLHELNPAVIKSKCARFALDERQKIAQFEKIRGEGLNDRAADTFDPLYVIARLAGVQWVSKLHAAALGLSPAGSKSSAAELLLEIYAMLVVTGRKKIFTRSLAEILREESAVLKDSAINELKISDLLRPYGIKPSLIRMGKQVARGYTREDFSEALARYVPKAEVEARIKQKEKEEKLFAEAEEFAEENKRFAKSMRFSTSDDDDD
jgi:hypothetical protein